LEKNKSTGVFIGIGGVTPSSSVSTPKNDGGSRFTSTVNSAAPSKATTPHTPHGHLNKSNRHSNDNRPSPYAATAHTTSVAAGRISFAFGFEGPCLSIDTACSSSLVALHSARRALQLHECDLAIVGGINLIDENLSLACALAGMTSSDGLSRTFDASADGYGRSEGCGIVVLKRFEDCQRDRTPFYCTVKGSAVQQDGSSASLTAPNALAQEAVMKAALKDANLLSSMERIRFIESHGTGTQYGDPVEVSSIAKVYGKHRKAEHPLFVTAVKANIGHLEAASGLAGIFSTILSFHQHTIFPNAHLKQLNPLVHQAIVANTTEKDSIIISSDAHVLRRIPEDQQMNDVGMFLAGVSSFGYSGTIAHVIVEEPPAELRKSISLATSVTSECHTTESMSFAKEFFGVKTDTSTDSPSEINKTQTDKKDNQEIDTGRKETSAPATNQLTPNPTKRLPTNPQLVFQFSGQGNLKVNSCRSFYDQDQHYREALQECSRIAQPWIGCNIVDILYPDIHRTFTTNKAEEMVSMTKYSQVILISLEYSLAKALMAQGMYPAAVTGHSLGEYTAAIIVGLITLTEGLFIATERGRLIEENEGCRGKMVAMRFDPVEMDKHLSLTSTNSAVPLAHRKQVSIAAINGYNSIILSGADASLTAVMKALNISTSIPLGVKHAFHSPLLQSVTPTFSQFLERNIHFRVDQLQASSIRYFSTYLGREVTSDETKQLATTDYWVGHMNQKVNYLSTIESLYSENFRYFVELGPEKVLMKLAQPILKSLSVKDNNKALGAHCKNEVVCIACIE
jgi:acyl transferase domain-containing protein